MQSQAVNTLESSKHGALSVTQHQTTFHAIAASAQQVPDKTAIRFFMSGTQYQRATVINYREMLKNITATANFFDALGIRDDDVVAFILPNLPETHYVLWGAQARCKAFAVNPLLEPEQIKVLLNHSAAKVVVTMNPMIKLDLWEKVTNIAADLDQVKHIVGIDIAQHISGAQGVLAKAIQWKKGLAIRLPDKIRYHNFTSSIARQNNSYLNFLRNPTDDTVSSMFCTGGTTGLPKIALRTHANELANAQGIIDSVHPKIGRDSVILGGLPIFHVNGALVTGLLPFTVGAEVVICTPQGYRGEEVFPNFWDILAHYKVSAFSGVPTVYSTLLDYPITGQDLSTLEFCICGAAPMPVQTFKDFETLSGAPILEAYGLTEGTCASSMNPIDGKRKVGSIGKRLPNQEMMVSELDDDNNFVRSCNYNEAGCLLIKGPNVFKGYLLPHQNKDIWIHDNKGNTWLNTGDLALEDEEGYFWLTGRKKELIVRGGHNIEPKMIEEVLCKHSSVHLAAAVGKPDEHAGEVPVCYVQVAKDDHIQVSDIIEFAQKNIPERAAIPKEIHLVHELPLTAVGKVFKPALEMQEIEKTVHSVLQQHITPEHYELNVYQNSKKGILADIRLLQVNSNTHDAIHLSLGQYVFKFEIR